MVRKIRTVNFRYKNNVRQQLPYSYIECYSYIDRYLNSTVQLTETIIKQYTVQYYTIRNKVSK